MYAGCRRRIRGNWRGSWGFKRMSAVGALAWPSAALGSADATPLPSCLRLARGCRLSALFALVCRYWGRVWAAFAARMWPVSAIALVCRYWGRVWSASPLECRMPVWDLSRRRCRLGIAGLVWRCCGECGAAECGLSGRRCRCRYRCWSGDAAALPSGLRLPCDCCLSALSALVLRYRIGIAVAAGMALLRGMRRG